MATKWMQKAMENAHGQFREKAMKAGMSTMAYANFILREGSKADLKTKRQAVAARNAIKASRGR